MFGTRNSFLARMLWSIQRSSKIENWPRRKNEQRTTIHVIGHSIFRAWIIWLRINENFIAIFVFSLSFSLTYLEAGTGCTALITLKPKVAITYNNNIHKLCFSFQKLYQHILQALVLVHSWVWCMTVDRHVERTLGCPFWILKAAAKVKRNE